MKKLVLPLLILVCVFLWVWIAASHLNQQGYIGVQSDLFITLNYFLNTSLGVHPLIWSNITYLGNALVALLLLSPLLLFQPKTWAAIFAAIPLAAIFSNVGKTLASVPRPAAFLDQQLFIIIDKALVGHSSLPSGHTITIFCILSAVVLCSKYHRYFVAIAIVGLAAASLIAISRIAVGAHWPLDVLVGGSLGYLAALSGIALIEAYPSSWVWMKKPKYVLILIALLLLFIWVLLNEELSFTRLNGVIWLASIVGLWTVFKFLIALKK